MYHQPTPPPSGNIAADTEVLLTLASAYVHFGQYRNAVVILKLALGQFPGHLDAIELLAHAAFLSGDQETADQAIEQLELLGSAVTKDLRVRQRLARRAARQRTKRARFGAAIAPRHPAT